ncbi:hypothetical protein [Agromyces badenianii]|uniref:hypothetical protein n=1 Tax=Agromyces badenianii TaxID=2080742 RepID=UPI00105AAAE5|nr:hypothetical protein [Agromyces badenianii]
MTAPRRAGRSRRNNRLWAGAGLIALAVVVLALTFVALTQNRSVPGAGTTPGSSPSATPEATRSEPPSATPAPVARPLAVPGRLIDAIDASSAVRAGATACPEPTTIEVTSDGGATWETAEPAPVSEVQRVAAGDDAFVDLIGLGVEGCAPAYERSFTSGDAWQPVPEELDASWFVDPSNRAGVHAPAGDLSAPCGVVVQLAVIDANAAAVLCEDGSVHATSDGGASWRSAAPVVGAAAIGTNGTVYRVAVVDQNGCVGAQLVELTAGDAGLVPGAAGACLAATVGAGEVAVDSVVGGATWLWAGDALGRSEDGGVSWL